MLPSKSKWGGGPPNPKALTQNQICAWVHFGGKSFLDGKESFWGGNDFNCFQAKASGVGWKGKGWGEAGVDRPRQVVGCVVSHAVVFPMFCVKRLF